MFQTNLREIDVDMNVEEVLDYLEQFGATAWLISVGGILANYPTNLPFHTRNPYLSQRVSGDLISDALDAAHSRGMRLLARMDFSKVQGKVAQEHPDWLYVSPRGEWQNHTAGLVSVCPSGQYYQERIFDILDEVTSRYQVDGFFVNWAGFNEVDYFKVYHGVCHCESCRARWREYAGDLELPNGPEDTNYPKWKEFSDEVIDDWTARVSAFVAEKLPDAGLILGESAQIRFHEANNAVDRETWHHATSETVSSLTSYRPDVPVLVNSVSFVDMPYRMGSEEPAQFAQYLLQTISRGGNPSTYIMGIPGKIPYLNLDIAKEITNFHKKWQEVYDGLEPVAKTGLVSPHGGQMNDTQYEEALSEFRGLYSAMQELHIPFDVIAQSHLSEISKSEGLKRYDVVILPNLGKLRSEDAGTLDEWVSQGGRLIATGTSGVGDDGVAQLKALPTERQRDVITDRESLWSTYFAPEQNRTDQFYYSGPIVPIYGAYSLFEWKEHAESRYKILDYAPFAPPEYAYGNIQGDERGCGISAFEKGKGIVIPFTVGRGYRELGLRVFRDFYEMILREDGSAGEKLEFDLAEQVEVTVNANGSRLVVHLINMSGMREQNFGSYLPIPGGSIKVSGVNVTAHALLSDSLLEVKDGEIKLPGLGLFDVVVIEGIE
ncbi:hypothetical protein DL769_001891 [Monosporascus sp. CRB-8-3]|nr:hypothetical protein DL769_001891 [Monosporascus sp. CRB-8-3]